MKRNNKTAKNAALREQLITHLSADFQKYRQSLLAMSPEEILEVAHSYHIRESALNAVIYTDFLSEAQMQALLEAKDPLQTIFNGWCDDESGETEFMDTLRVCVAYAANGLRPHEADHIDWDVDDEQILATLPEIVPIPAGVKPADVMDYLEEAFGYPVLGCGTRLAEEV